MYPSAIKYNSLLDPAEELWPLWERRDLGQIG